MPSLSEKLGITNFAIYIIMLILGVGVTYGAITVRLNALEEKTQKYQNDHELILVLNTKMDQLSSDLREIKNDLRELKSRR
jgi:hypothetical protein